MLKPWMDALDVNSCKEAVFSLIVDSLRSSESGECQIEEYQLIRTLESECAFKDLAQFTPMLQLFGKHFLLRHCLYGLVGRLAESGVAIDLGLVRISFTRVSVSPNACGDIALHRALEHFYCDFKVLDTVTEDSVAALISGFWDKYAAFEQADDCYVLLGLEKGAEWPDVQAAYRRLVQRHHPDKGGDAERFAAIREAYEALKRIRAC